MTARKPAVERVLVLRTCNADMTSHGGFRWPTRGTVTAPDWEPTAKCGNGLHGLLWGEGDGSRASWKPDAKWLVVSVAASDVVNLDGKVKFRAGRVVYCGDRIGATSYIAERASGKVIVGGTATAGDGGTATAGYRGTATAGDGGTATAGYRGTATAGYRGTATAGYGGPATAGYGGIATAGDGGIATAGYGGTATAGYGGIATAGDRGTATAGTCGTATAGDYGTATAGDYGTATAGTCGTATARDRGTLSLRWHDGSRYRLAVFYVDDAGIEPGVAYRCENGKAVRA